MIKKGLFYMMAAFFVCMVTCGQIPDNVTPTVTPTPSPEPTVSAEIDFFADYNGEKIQRIVSEEGDVYTPSMCDDIIFYCADEEETLEEILVVMKTAIMEPLTTPSEDRPFTVTAYDVSSQEKIVELEENMWCLPVLEGKYKFDGMDFVTMEDRLEFEEPDENGLLDFLRQGSGSLFQFILLKEGDVYRLQRLVRMSEIAPELKRYEELD